MRLHIHYKLRNVTDFFHLHGRLITHGLAARPLTTSFAQHPCVYERDSIGTWRAMFDTSQAGSSQRRDFEHTFRVERPLVSSVLKPKFGEDGEPESFRDGGGPWVGVGVKLNVGCEVE